MGPAFQVIPVMTPRGFNVGGQGPEDPARGELHRVLVVIDSCRQVRGEEGSPVVTPLDVAHVPGQVAAAACAANRFVRDDAAVATNQAPSRCDETRNHSAYTR